MSVDFSQDLILVTCASGKQVGFLLPFLAKKWKKLRLAVNTEASRQRLGKAYPAADVVRADLTEPSVCRKLLEGVTAVYHVGPSFHLHETQMGYNMIDAATAQGNSFRHFVFSSVLNTQVRKMSNHDNKRYVEEYLIESGLNYTILNPSNFTDNFPVQQAFETGVCMWPWNTHTRSSWTCLYDLAEVGATVLEQREKHYLAQYQIVSTEPLNMDEECEIASAVLGKRITTQVLPFDMTMADDANKLLGFDSHPHVRDATRRMVLYYSYGGIRGSPNCMRWILGRDPMSLEEWLRGKVATLKGEKFDFLEARRSKS